MRKQFLTYILLAISLVGLSIWPLNAAAAEENWPTIIQQLEAARATNNADTKINSSLATAYNNYGLTFAHQKQWQQAEIYLQKAAATDPSNNNIRLNLSNIYFEHGFELFQSPDSNAFGGSSHSQAKQLATQAIEFNPNNINAILLLGDIEYMNQNMQEAQASWQKASLLAPQNQQIKQRLDKISREANTESGMQDRYNTYFIIKINRDSDNIPGFDISASLDAARIAVSNDFNYLQKHKIPVIVYSVSEYQSTLKDAPEWSDGAYDGKLRIILYKNRPNFKQVNSTIVHEYTHAVIADLTDNNCPRWFNEGIAKYEEYKHGVKPLISVLAMAYNTNNLLAWDQVDNAYLSSSKSEVLLAYEQSFSFVYYIVDKYGMSKLVYLLNSLSSKPDFADAFAKTYGVQLVQVQKDWKFWVANYIETWAETPTPIVD